MQSQSHCISRHLQCARSSYSTKKMGGSAQTSPHLTCVSGRSSPVHKRHKSLLEELKSTDSDILPNEGYDLTGRHKIKLLGQDWHFLFNKVEIKQERLERAHVSTRSKGTSFHKAFEYVHTCKQCADLEPMRSVLINPDKNRTFESLWHT